MMQRNILSKKTLQTMKNKETHRAFNTAEFTRMHSVGGEDSRTFQFIISTETKDRHGTIIRMDAWNLENYNANPVVAYMHQTDGGVFSSDGANPDHILGPGRAFVENGQLIGEVTFEDFETNPLADKIMRKIVSGSLRATSVGFKHNDGHWGERAANEDTDTFYYTDVDLLEFSIVNIPSNPDAVIRAYDTEIKKSLPAKPNEEVKQEENGENLTDLVRESQLFINQKFIKNV